MPNYPTYSSIAVANYFVKKSMDGSLPGLTLMKLIKLCYIANGWRMALTDGDPLIGDPVQAWKYGPVYPEIYREFQDYRDPKAIINKFGQLSSGRANRNRFPEVDDPETIEFLDLIVELYGNQTAYQLSDLTHREGTPWSKIHDQWGKDLKRNKHKEIPMDLIYEHYKDLLLPEA